MKFDRNILEKLVETNAEAYSLLHYQYTTLESRHASLENEYREVVRRGTASELIDPNVFNEVKSAYSESAMLLAEAQEELNHLEVLREENAMLRTNLHDLEHDYLKATEARDVMQNERNAYQRSTAELHDMLEALRHDVRVGHERIADLEHSYKVASEEIDIELANNRTMHKLLKEAQEKQQAAEYAARMYQAKYEELPCYNGYT